LHIFLSQYCQQKCLVCNDPKEDPDFSFDDSAYTAVFLNLF
jgi:hypothetical protein